MYQSITMYKNRNKKSTAVISEQQRSFWKYYRHVQKVQYMIYEMFWPHKSPLSIGRKNM